MTRPTKRTTKRPAAKLATVVPIRAPRPKLAPITQPLDPSRDVHRTMRGTIERDGDEGPRTLLAYFDRFNADHFAGMLGAPMILITATSNPRAWGDYIPRDVHGFQSRIRIAPAVGKLGWRYAIGALLHEMIHAWQHEIAGDFEPGYKHHGPKFAGKANAIGRVLGFPECSPKGRGGKARAEQWPTLPVMEWDGPKPKAPKPPRRDENDVDDDAPRDVDGLGPSIDVGRLERAKVRAFLAARARRALERGKPKFARSLENLADALERLEHHKGVADEST